MDSTTLLGRVANQSVKVTLAQMRIASQTCSTDAVHLVMILPGSQMGRASKLMSAVKHATENLVSDHRFSEFARVRMLRTWMRSVTRIAETVHQLLPS